MFKDLQTKILLVLGEAYPEQVYSHALAESLSTEQRDLDRHVTYLSEKGLVEVQWLSGGFLAKITVSGINHAGIQIGDRDTIRKAMERLERSYPESVDSEEIEKLLDTDWERSRRLFKYLEETGLVEVRWYVGKQFAVRATADGLDQLENL